MRIFLASALAVVVSLSASIPATSRAAEQPVPRSATTLAERLTTGLEARLPEDFAYADQVADLVQRGILPSKIVDSAFLWARKHGGRYPFPYFRRALAARAAKFGVKL